MQAPSMENVRRWIRLVQAEFVEMPGMHLSKRQAQRLWNLDPLSADIVFDALESAHFLRRTGSDMYIRADVGV